MGAGVPRRAGTLQVRDGSRMDLFLKGELTVEDLTDEEIATGRLNASDGSRRGRPPMLIPATFHQAVIRELLTRGNRMFREHLFDSVETLARIAKDPRVEPRDRIKAAMAVVDRVMGKVPEKVELTDSRKSSLDEMLERAAEEGFDFGHYKSDPALTPKAKEAVINGTAEFHPEGGRGSNGTRRRRSSAGGDD